MNELHSRSEAELVQAWLDHALTPSQDDEHVGATNRRFNNAAKVIEELKSRSNGRLTSLRPLLDHADPRVRFDAALQFRQIDPDIFRSSLMRLEAEGGDIGRSATAMLAAPPFSPPRKPPPLPANHPLLWQANNPPPGAMPIDLIVQRLREIDASASEDLLKLARPAIGLWPQRPRPNMPMQASRLGGLPNVPPGFEWPMGGTEPMLFLGQINCADIKGLPGSEHFPAQGLLAFFGDFDTVNGCMMTGLGGAVRYWPQIDHLIPANPPLEPLEIFLKCELAFRPLTSLPHPESEILRTVLRDEPALRAYRSFHSELITYGIPAEVAPSCGFSKLLGWPDLVQGDDLDFFLDSAGSDFRLLLQIESYGDGDNIEGYGPGGSLYAMISENALAAGRFENSQLTGQFT